MRTYLSLIQRTLLLLVSKYHLISQQKVPLSELKIYFKFFQHKLNAAN